MSWNEKEYTETNGEWVWLKAINTFEKKNPKQTKEKKWETEVHFLDMSHYWLKSL